MRYEVKRYITEHFSVEAESREEAFRKAINPFKIEVVNQTAKKIKQ